MHQGIAERRHQSHIAERHQFAARPNLCQSLGKASPITHTLPLTLKRGNPSEIPLWFQVAHQKGVLFTTPKGRLWYGAP